MAKQSVRTLSSNIPMLTSGWWMILLTSYSKDMGNFNVIHIRLLYFSHVYLTQWELAVKYPDTTSEVLAGKKR